MSDLSHIEEKIDLIYAHITDSLERGEKTFEKIDVKFGEIDKRLNKLEGWKWFFAGGFFAVSWTAPLLLKNLGWI